MNSSTASHSPHFWLERTAQNSAHIQVIHFIVVFFDVLAATRSAINNVLRVERVSRWWQTQAKVYTVGRARSSFRKIKGDFES